MPLVASLGDIIEMMRVLVKTLAEAPSVLHLEDAISSISPLLQITMEVDKVLIFSVSKDKLNMR